MPTRIRCETLALRTWGSQKQSVPQACWRSQAGSPICRCARQWAACNRARAGQPAPAQSTHTHTYA
eukprot:75551-Pyramimonas_sp.AAC.1